MLEMARARVSGTGTMSASLPPAALRTFRRVALLGLTFGTDELLAVADGIEDETYGELELALAALVVEPAEGGYRFRHPLVREGLVDQLPPHQRSRGHQRVAEALAALDRPPGRVAHHYLAAGLPSRAVPYVVRAVETAGALGAFRDALTLVDGVRGHAGPEPPARAAVTPSRPADGARRPQRRGGLHRGSAGHDRDPAPPGPGAPGPGGGGRRRPVDSSVRPGGSGAAGRRGRRARSCWRRASWPTSPATWRRPWRVATEARERLRGVDDPWHLVDLVGLQGLLAHQRGEWFASFRTELRRTQGHDRLAGALFDAHLCVAENLLYGREPYPEIIAEAEQLRLRASQDGALRGVAFATALIGEAALMMGDVDRAEAELDRGRRAARRHRLGRGSGPQHAAAGRGATRPGPHERGHEQLLDEALLLARWSTIGMHLLQRIFGTLIVSAPDAASARAMVDRAEAPWESPTSAGSAP